MIPRRRGPRKVAKSVSEEFLFLFEKNCGGQFPAHGPEKPQNYLPDTCHLECVLVRNLF